MIDAVMNGDNPRANTVKLDKSEPVSISNKDNPTILLKSGILMLDTKILLPNLKINKQTIVKTICLKIGFFIKVKMFLNKEAGENFRVFFSRDFPLVFLLRFFLIVINFNTFLHNFCRKQLLS